MIFKDAMIVFGNEFFMCRQITFICGRAGVCALGAVAAKHSGNDTQLHKYLQLFHEVISNTSI